MLLREAGQCASIASPPSPLIATYTQIHELSSRSSEVSTPIGVYTFPPKRQLPSTFTPLSTQSQWPEAIELPLACVTPFSSVFAESWLGSLGQNTCKGLEQSLSKEVSFFYTILPLILFQITVQSNLKKEEKTDWNICPVSQISNLG